MVGFEVFKTVPKLKGCILEYIFTRNLFFKHLKEVHNIHFIGWILQIMLIIKLESLFSFNFILQNFVINFYIEKKPRF